MIRHPLAVAVLSISTACSVASAAELFLLGAVSYSYATSVSDDGRVVGGYDPQSYWYWTRETGVVQLIGTTIPPGNGVGGASSQEEAMAALPASSSPPPSPPPPARRTKRLRFADEV